jgi:integrase
MASIRARKRVNGEVSFQVQFRIDGTMTGESFSDLETAKAFGRMVDRVGGKAARAVLDSRSKLEDAGMTLRVWTEQVLTKSNGMLGGTTDRTIADYRRIADRSFLTVLGEDLITELSVDRIGQWIAWQESQKAQKTGQPLAAKTIRNYQGLLSSILAVAVDRGLIARNWAKGAAIAQGHAREPTFLSAREFGTILRFIPEYYRPLTLFLAMTGTRWSEATAIEWRDISFDSSPVTVRVNKAWKKGADGVMRIGQPKTKKSRRTIALDSETIRALGSPGLPESRVFVGKLGADRVWYGRFRESVFQKAVTSARDPIQCKALGLEPITKQPTIHDLRHTHASWLIAQNLPLPNIQNRLGHESITTTIDTYGHLAPESMSIAALAVGEIFGSVMDASGIQSTEPAGGF